MPLRELVECIERLRERVGKHEPLLRQNEMWTRYVLIDPLLRALAWDTEDLTQVQPEHQTAGGRADYALLSGGTPRVFIEAKKLGTPLAQGIDQSINYCLQQGTPYFVVTDGRKWELYETHKLAPLAQKRVVAFDLFQDPAHEVALKALCLWHPNASAPQVTSAGASVVETLGRPPPPPPSQPGKTLATIQVKPNDKPPTRVRFPDGTEKQLQTWKSLLVATAEWLLDTGKLRPEHCPVQPPDAMRYLVHTVSEHPSGRDFVGRVQIGPLWLETNHSAPYLARLAHFLVQRMGEDPERFLVS